MKRILVYGGLLSLMAMPVPWFFVKASNGPDVFGLPAWAFYSIASSLVFATLIALVMGRLWEWSAGADERELEE